MVSQIFLDYNFIIIIKKYILLYNITLYYRKKYIMIFYFYLGVNIIIIIDNQRFIIINSFSIFIADNIIIFDN